MKQLLSHALTALIVGGVCFNYGERAGRWNGAVHAAQFSVLKQSTPENHVLYRFDDKLKNVAIYKLHSQHEIPCDLNTAGNRALLMDGDGVTPFFDLDVYIDNIQELNAPDFYIKTMCQHGVIF